MLWSEKPIRPSPEIREPEVSGLLLHDLISENLEIMSSQINETFFLPPGRFFPSTRLNRRYDPSDNKDLV